MQMLFSWYPYGLSWTECQLNTVIDVFIFHFCANPLLIEKNVTKHLFCFFICWLSLHLSLFPGSKYFSDPLTFSNLIQSTGYKFNRQTYFYPRLSDHFWNWKVKDNLRVLYHLLVACSNVEKSLFRRIKFFKMLCII